MEEFKSTFILLQICNLRVNQLIQKFPSYNQRGLSIFSFFESPKESMQKYIGSQNPPFPLIPDPKRNIYKLYGVETHLFKFIAGLLNLKIWKAMSRGFLPGKIEGNISMISADFLIENGKIVHAYYGKDSSDHIPMETIEAFLK